MLYTNICWMKAAKQTQETKTTRETKNLREKVETLSTK